MAKYRLARLYAFSAQSGRGMELRPDPRNGLSRTTYSGAPGTVVQLDADPKVKLNSNVPLLYRVAKVALPMAIVAGIIWLCRPLDWQHRLQAFSEQNPGWPLMLVALLLAGYYITFGFAQWYK
eukprot:SM000195S05302  [mRNA]  locus=s195:220353:221023:- [translate_table: standard]